MQIVAQQNAVNQRKKVVAKVKEKDANDEKEEQETMTRKFCLEVNLIH